MNILAKKLRSIKILETKLLKKIQGKDFFYNLNKEQIDTILRGLEQIKNRKTILLEKVIERYSKRI